MSNQPVPPTNSYPPQPPVGAPQGYPPYPGGYPQPPMTTGRPTGVTILAVLGFIGGALDILGSFALIAAGMFLGAVAQRTAGEFLGVGAVLLGVLLLLTGIVALVFGYGAWMLKPWAWMLGIIVEGLNIVLAIARVINGSSVFSALISIAVAGAIIYYLFTPEVKRAFGRP